MVVLLIVLLLLLLTPEALRFLSLKRDEATVLAVLVVRVVLRGSLAPLPVFLLVATRLLFVVDVFLLVLSENIYLV